MPCSTDCDSPELAYIPRLIGDIHFHSLHLAADVDERVCYKLHALCSELL
jgi:hypothetical protein